MPPAYSNETMRQVNQNMPRIIGYAQTLLVAVESHPYVAEQIISPSITGYVNAAIVPSREIPKNSLYLQAVQGKLVEVSALNTALDAEFLDDESATRKVSILRGANNGDKPLRVSVAGYIPDEEFYAGWLAIQKPGIVRTSFSLDPQRKKPRMITVVDSLPQKTEIDDFGHVTRARSRKVGGRGAGPRSASFTFDMGLQHADMLSAALNAVRHAVHSAGITTPSIVPDL